MIYSRPSRTRWYTFQKNSSQIFFIKIIESPLAYIIGGLGGRYVSTIAQFKNNQWLKIGDLNEKKRASSAISHMGEYLIVGGYVNSGRSVNLFKIIFLQSRNIAIN